MNDDVIPTKTRVWQSLLLFWYAANEKLTHELRHADNHTCLAQNNLSSKTRTQL